MHTNMSDLPWSLVVYLIQNPVDVRDQSLENDTSNESILETISDGSSFPQRVASFGEEEFLPL